MNKIEEKFATYQFKIPLPLWNKFKIKSIQENDDTYRDTLINVIRRFVNT